MLTVPLPPCPENIQCCLSILVVFKFFQSFYDHASQKKKLMPISKERSVPDAALTAAVASCIALSVLTAPVASAGTPNTVLSV